MRKKSSEFSDEKQFAVHILAQRSSVRFVGTIVLSIFCDFGGANELIM